MRKIFLIVVLNLSSFSLLNLLTLGSVSAREFDCSAHIEVSQGDVPILLTAPHGAPAKRKLKHVPERNGVNASQFNILSDQYTDQIINGVEQALIDLNAKPFLVKANVSRRQVDFNRSFADAYEHDKARLCYEHYHDQIRLTIDHIKQRWQHGLLIDIHGQGRRSEQLIRGTRNGKTIKGLVDRHGQDVSESQGGLFDELRAKGYEVAPNMGEREQYYVGGYTVQRYGSHNANGIDAFQIEINRDIRASATLRNKFSDDLATAILAMQQAYYSSN